MKIVNIQEAKTHLSRLVEEASAGQTIVIAKAGRPRVRLTPCSPEASPRKLGGWEGKVSVGPGFDQVDDAIIALFAGEAVPARRGAKRA
jgi:prevent-host-death family protein